MTPDEFMKTLDFVLVEGQCISSLRGDLRYTTGAKAKSIRERIRYFEDSCRELHKHLQSASEPVLSVDPAE